MTTPSNPIEPFTPFLPATFTIPEEKERLNVFLIDTFSSISDVVNEKKIGNYTQNSSSLNGETWIYDTSKKIRNGYQAIARIPNFIPQTIPLPIDDVNPQFIISHVWGSASLPCTSVGAGDGDYFSFYSQGNVRIQFTMSDTQLIITTDGTTANYQGFIVIEFIRDGI